MMAPLLSALLTSTSAQARPAIGTSWSYGPSVILNTWYQSPFDLPTLDVRLGATSISLSAVDLLASVAEGSGPAVAADASWRWHERPVASGVTIIDRPGVEVALSKGYSTWMVGYRAGIQLGDDDGAGFSLCLRPGVGAGFVAIDGNLDMRPAISSRVELSVWGGPERRKDRTEGSR